MTSLHRLARAQGVETEYLSVTGERCIVGDETLRAILDAMGVPLHRKESEAPAAADRADRGAPATCFIPPWLRRERCWGLACQLYGLRSRRNWGIGDFADLASLAELMAGLGADFIGLNPLHALFPQDPERCSPYGPSSRAFLNPLYIAPDLLPGGESLAAGVDARELARVRESELVDYAGVARLKRAAFERVFAGLDRTSEDWRAFEAFRKEQGAALERFARHNALGEQIARERGVPLTWPQWPAAYADPDSAATARFADERPDRVTFQAWLQWLAVTQLAQAQARAQAAGMRIGLYTDLAVGVAADGAMTWGAPDLVLRGVSIGAPPDSFNEGGQDWGLAPFRPSALLQRGMAPLREDLRVNMAHAGAMRLDHAMALSRLYWVPRGNSARHGAYVRYPFEAMVRALAAESHRARCVVIGEALGTVPKGFRARLAAADMLAYRVLLFERRRDGGFRLPRAWSRMALACVSTHDLPTLAGWWVGRDIDWRERAGLQSPEFSAAQRENRARARSLLLDALGAAGLRPETAPGRKLSAALASAVHRYVARTPARLFAMQLEDALGLEEQANLPGDTHLHPNWRRRLPVALEALHDHPGLARLVSAVVAERRRPQ